MHAKAAIRFGAVALVAAALAAVPALAGEEFFQAPAFELPESGDSLAWERFDFLTRLDEVRVPSVALRRSPTSPRRSDAIVRESNEPTQVARKVKPNPFRIPSLHPSEAKLPWDKEPQKVQPPPMPAHDRST